MKKGWQTKMLGEAFTTVTGNTPPKGNAEFYGDFMPLVKPPELCDSQLDAAEDGLSKAGVKVSRVAQPDSILVSCIGNLGKVGWPTVPVAFNQQINAILPDPKKADPGFIFYQVLSPAFKDQLEALASGTTVPIVNKSKFNSIQIVLPPLAEQQRITGILDEAFEGLATAKAHAEKNLQNARALFESSLQSIFTQRGPGWVEKPFEDCIEDVKYTTKIQRKAFLEVGQFPVVSQESEFTNGFWDNAADVFKVSRPIVIFGDHTQVLKYIDFDFVLGADGVKILPPRPFLLPKFFYYALRSAPLKTLGYARHYRLLKELRIGYPNTKTQGVIVEKFDSLNEETQRLANLYTRKLSALEALKKSLLHQAFSGAL